MAREIHDDRLEVFAFADTGLAAVLEEAIRLLRIGEYNGKPFAEQRAELHYSRGTHYLVLPFQTEEDPESDG